MLCIQRVCGCEYVREGIDLLSDLWRFMYSVRVCVCECVDLSSDPGMYRVICVQRVCACECECVCKSVDLSSDPWEVFVWSMCMSMRAYVKAQACGVLLGGTEVTECYMYTECVCMYECVCMCVKAQTCGMPLGGMCPECVCVCLCEGIDL